ncbi:MAG: 3-dehydroquinate synthase, partial [Nannocystaceae bacterium]
MGSTPKPRRKRPKLLVQDVRVPGEPRSYPVVVGQTCLSRIGSELRQRHPLASCVALVSDTNVMPLYGERVTKSLEAEGFQVVAIEIGAGEVNKTPACLLEVVDKMLHAGLGRRDAVVALGGGVVGDLTGLAAALFMRGIALIQCPTSLLAQVDASVGGKVAVDLPSGKNLLGAFHFPLAVLIDPEVLGTLPDREMTSGLAEMLKHGALFSVDHFNDAVACADAVYERDVTVLARLVATSVALKAACVGRDPWEKGEAGKGRVVLNLGHTLGHAIESASDYALSHGAAVGLGMRAAARLSERRGLAAEGFEQQMVEALTKLRLPTDLDAWLCGERREAVERALMHDKKRAAGKV